MRCAELSLAAGEVLAATAVNAERWLLVEVPGSWPRDVGVAGALPEAAQESVGAWLDETGRGSSSCVDLAASPDDLSHS